MSHGDEWDKKVWVTKSDHNATLFEYANKTMYRKDTPTKENVVYRLSYLVVLVIHRREAHLVQIFLEIPRI